MSGRVSPKEQTGSVIQHGRFVVASFQNDATSGQGSTLRPCARTSSSARLRVLALSLNVDCLPILAPTQDGDAHAEHEHEESDEADAGDALDHARCWAQES